MTKQELDNMIPHKTMVYPKSEGKGVQYMFMEIDSNGLYQLCGMPFAYEDYLMKNSFEVVK